MAAAPARNTSMHRARMKGAGSAATFLVLAGGLIAFGTLVRWLLAEPPVSSTRLAWFALTVVGLVVIGAWLLSDDPVRGGPTAQVSPFDRVPQDGEPSDNERAIAGAWVGLRRFICWGACAFFLYAFVMAARHAQWHAAIIALVVAVLTARWGWVGGGVSRGRFDALEVHRQRKKRYGWKL